MHRGGCFLFGKAGSTLHVITTLFGSISSWLSVAGVLLLLEWEGRGRKWAGAEVRTCFPSNSGSNQGLPFLPMGQVTWWEYMTQDAPGSSLFASLCQSPCGVWRLPTLSFVLFSGW